MKTSFKLVIVVLTFSFKLLAQQDPMVETQRLIALSQKLQGTYQVQVINSREKAAMPLSILDSVEAKRHKTETVYFWLKSNTRVMILPESIINKKGFKPIERVVNISLEEAK